MGRKPRPANKIGRKRRVAGWMLLTLGVVVGALWAASGWWWFEFCWSHRVAGLSNGRIFVWAMYPSRSGTKPAYAFREHSDGQETVFFLEGALKDPPESSRSIAEHSRDRRGWVWWEKAGPCNYNKEMAYSAGVCAATTLATGKPFDTMAEYSVLLWPIPLLLCTPAALLLRSGILARRRAMTNACLKCGYSLAGLANDAPCPECGQGGPKAD